MKLLNAHKILACSALILLFSACGPDERKETPVTSYPTAEDKSAPLIHFTLSASYPHDTTAFTEGFLFYEGTLFESTGSPDYLPQTRSLFGPVDLKTGKIDKKVELDRSRYFGEGIAFLNNKIYQLTYRNQTAFVYDASNYRRTGQFSYMSREGWGLTTDGRQLIMSDGSNALTFIDPNTYQVVKTVVVSENNVAVDYLNELEYINGYIYANVWMSHKVVKIQPENGEVVGRLDLTQLAEDAKRLYKGSMETNGIAWDSLTGKILVTGKMWPKVYEIKFPV